MNPNIGLSGEQRTAVVKILNTLLSDEYLLYSKTRNYHRNVLGPQFNDLHKFFEEEYTELNVVVDDVAERARSLGGWAIGTLSATAGFGYVGPLFPTGADSRASHSNTVPSPLFAATKSDSSGDALWAM
jgi:hypothetical protein